MFLFRHSVCIGEKNTAREEKTRRNIYKINECICYAPLNRLLSVYRPALRETISKLILFFSSLFCFHSISFVSGFAGSNAQRTSKGTRKKLLFWQVYSNLSSCESMTRAEATAAVVRIYVFICPYGVVGRQ